MKTKHKILSPLFALGVLLLSAGCANHDNPAAVEAAPGVTAPATTTPPLPMTYKPGFMEHRRKAALPSPTSR